MALDTYNIVNRINQLQADLQRSGLTASGICALLALQGDNIGTTRYSQGLSRIKPFSNQEGAVIETLLQEVTDLRDSHLPLPISLRDPSLIAPLLAARRKLKREVVAPPQIFVVTIGGYYFVEIDRMGQLVTSTFASMAGKTSLATAQRLVLEIEKRCRQAVEIHSCPTPGEATPFEKLWGLPPVEDDIIVGEAEAQ